MQRLARVTLLGALLLGTLGNGPATAGGAATRRVETPAHDVKTGDDGARSKRAANALRQFTGYVSAIDKSSITVEKRGRNPETRVFEKLDGLRTTGDVGKDARVTVYYREEGGKAVAHRVVVKPARAGAKSRS
jgi:hypothetical protein